MLGTEIRHDGLQGLIARDLCDLIVGVNSGLAFSTLEVAGGSKRSALGAFSDEIQSLEFAEVSRPLMRSGSADFEERECEVGW